MTKTTERNILVYADWIGLPKPARVGTLFATPTRHSEIFSFEYDINWLRNDKTHTLDPALQAVSGRQYPGQTQNNFGLFLDSSPDRWGRFLMNRRTAEQAREQQTVLKPLRESDYLLGVYDAYRAGALRFKLDEHGPFLDNQKNLAAPPWTSLRAIEQASFAIEKKGAEEKKSYQKWLNMLIAPGGSLGGARPKACVLDEKNHPWIAKFPSHKDEYDLGAWEMVTHQLAKRAGILTPEARLEQFQHHHHTFLSKRFDRKCFDQRIHFASAVTLLQRHDGDDASVGASYLELAEFIMQFGANVEEDLSQLWRRIVFNMCVSNVDDHLRNHGFIFQPGRGWKLSPAYDMNPDPLGDGLKLNISETDNAQHLALAKDVAPYFRMNVKNANQTIKQVISAVRQWQSIAKQLKIPRQEQMQMAAAFRVVE